MIRKSLILLIWISSSVTAYSQVNPLPLFSMEKLQYEGAFIIPSGIIGESESDYGSGTIEYNPSNHSLFLSGKQQDGAIAEFAIPPLVSDLDLNLLNTATTLQNFKRVFILSPDGNPQNIELISGMKLYNNSLIVNGVEYYDAPADNTHTTLTISDASNISNSSFQGLYSLSGAAHVAGWISAIPSEWQSSFGASYLSGNSSRYPIVSRLCVGASAFGIDLNQISGSAQGVVSTDVWMDFDLYQPLYADYNYLQNPRYNILSADPAPAVGGHTAADINAIVGDNNIWTAVSSAAYGFIVPQSRTYLTIGHSGGHNSGIGYKPLQTDGNLCGGPCPYDADDKYNYYWLYDLNDLLAVKNGTINPYDVRPYEHGEFDAPFQTDFYSNSSEFHPIVGGTFDATSDLLYLTLYDGGAMGAWTKNPVILSYKLIYEEICDGIDNNGDGQVDEKLVNAWVGPQNGLWYEDAAYWSLAHFPNTCNKVQIDPNYSVSLLSGETAYAYTLDVKQNASLSIDDNAELHVLVNE